MLFLFFFCVFAYGCVLRSYLHFHSEMTSPSSSMGSLGPPSPRQRTSSGDLSEFYVPMEIKKKIKSTAPKKPPRRNLSVSPTHLNECGGNISHGGRDGCMSMSVDGYTPMGNRSGGSGSDSSSKLPGQQQGPVNYEYIFLAHTGSKKDNAGMIINERKILFLLCPFLSIG